MKKRVRIYKAQQGGVPQQKQISETELMDMTYKLLTGGSEPEEVLTSLVSSGVQQDLANKAISSVVEYINDEQAKMDADRDQDMDAKEDLMAEEQADQDEAMRQAEYESRQKAMQEMYYGEYEEDPGAEAEEDAVVDDLIMKTGGKMPSKRTFVRNYIKQAGGVQEDGRADSTGATERNNDLSRFVGTLKDKGNQALMKQDAEAMYESMQQDGGDVESPVMAFDPYHNLAHYSDTFEHAMPSMQTGLVEAQFGGGMTRGQERRMGRRYNRMLRNIPMGFNPGGPGMFPGAMNIYTMGNLPMQQMPAAGSYYGGVQLANIDVRRTGLFGRPKEYTINFFSPTPVTQQDVSNVIKQEENNIKETEKEVTEDKKQEEVDTATDKNAEVQKEAGKETAVAGTTTTPQSGGKKSTVVTKPVVTGEDKTPVEVPIYQGEPWRQTLQQNYDARLADAGADSDYFENSPFAYRSLSSYPMGSQGPWEQALSGRNPNLYVPPVEADESESYKAWLKSKGYPDSAKYKQMYNASKSKTNTNSNKSLATNAAKVKANAAKVAANKAKVQANAEKWRKASDKYYEETDPFGGGNPTIGWRPEMQIGGFVDPSNPELYKFIYGGADDLAIPMADGKLTNDPYFEYGGLVKAQRGMTTITDKFGNTKKVTADEAAVWQRSKAENPEARLEDVSFQSEKPIQRNPAIQEQLLDYNNPYIGNTYVGGPYDQYGYPPYGYAPNMRLSTLGVYGYNPMVSYAGSWAQQQGLPYDPNTGQPISGRIYNPALQSIDVKKSSWLTGAPKKYTMYFQGQGEPGTAIDKAYKPGTWYKGSDGQMQYTGDTSNKGTSSSEKSSYDPTGLSRRQRRADENYKKIYGHYPGEGRSKSETIDAPLRGIPQAEVPNLDIIPGVDAYKGRTPNLTPVGKLPTRPLSPIDTQGRQDIIPGTMSYQGMPLREEEEEVIGGPFNTAGPVATQEDEVVTPEFGNYQGMPTAPSFSAPFNMAGPYATEEDMIPEYQLPQDPRVDYANESLQLPFRPGPGLFDNYVDYSNIMSGNPSDLDMSGMPYGDMNPMFTIDPVTKQPVRVRSNPPQRRNVSTQPRNNNRNNNRDIPTRNNNASAEQYVRRQRETYTPSPSTSKARPESAREVQQLQKDRELYGMYLQEYGVDKGRKMFLKDNPQLSYIVTGKTKKYGGILAKAQIGLNTFSTAASDIPPGYFKDPVTGLIKNFAGEVYQPKTSLTDSQTLMTNPYKFEKNTATGEEPAIKMGTEGTYENTGLLTAKDKEKQSQQQMAVDVKNKNMFNVDFQQGLDQFNKYGNMFAQMLEGKDEAARQRELYDQLAAENIYGSTSVTDRGTYDVNSGLFRQDEMGFTGVIKYGGNIKQEGGPMEDDDYGYSEEEEVYMTPEEIEQFLMDGGDLEFI